MECADMSALWSEATCRLGKTPPKTGALQIALFGGLETPKVFASGRPLLAHVDPSTAREVDRPLRRAMLNKSRPRRHYLSIEPRTLSGLDPPSRATRIGRCIFRGKKQYCIYFPVLIQARK